MSIAIAALAALLAVGWLSIREPRPALSAVAPEPAPEVVEDVVHAATESLRSSIPSPIGQQPSAAAATQHPPPALETGRERMLVASGRITEFRSTTLPSSLGGLEALEAELSAEISASTADELRRRFQIGLGEFAGAGDDFDIGKAWLHDRIMITVSPGDGTHWRVSLPREEFPEAYALFDRRAAVRTQIEEERRLRGSRRQSRSERNPNAPPGE